MRTCLFLEKRGTWRHTGVTRLFLGHMCRYPLYFLDQTSNDIPPTWRLLNYSILTSQHIWPYQILIRGSSCDLSCFYSFFEIFWFELNWTLVCSVTGCDGGREGISRNRKEALRFDHIMSRSCEVFACRRTGEVIRYELIKKIEWKINCSVVCFLRCLTVQPLIGALAQT